MTLPSGPVCCGVAAGPGPGGAPQSVTRDLSWGYCAAACCTRSSGRPVFNYSEAASCFPRPPASRRHFGVKFGRFGSLSAPGLEGSLLLPGGRGPGETCRPALSGQGPGASQTPIPCPLPWGPWGLQPLPGSGPDPEFWPTIQSLCRPQLPLLLKEALEGGGRRSDFSRDSFPWGNENMFVTVNTQNAIELSMLNG